MGGKWREFVKELEKVSCLAAPMVAVTVMQYLLPVISVIMVGQIDDMLLLSGVSIATSFTSVTGFSLLSGMAGALEALWTSLWSKTFSAAWYLYILLHHSLTLVCFPIAVLSLFSDKLLMMIGQDPSISQVAYKYSLYLIPNLFSYAILQSLFRYFQTQKFNHSNALQLLCYFVLPYTSLFGFSVQIKVRLYRSCISNPFILLAKCHLAGLLHEVLFSLQENKGRVLKGCSSALEDILPLRYSLSCHGLVLILLCGLLPNPELETSVLSICFTITYLHYFIPCAFGATASTRVSNELGAGNPESAKLEIWTIVCLAATEIITGNTILFICRHIVGFLFSSERQIVDHIADMAPLICLSVVVDNLHFQGLQEGLGGSTWVPVSI